MLHEEQEDIVYLYFSGRDENNIDIDLSEWEPEWADYVPSNIISTPVRTNKRGRVPTQKQIENLMQKEIYYH